MRKAIVVSWLGFLFTGIIALFWYHEWIYQLPTPVPANYQVVKVNEVLNLPSITDKITDRPVFLHFFNPECPCSRFNIPHFKTLVSTYGSKVDFRVVVMSDKMYSEKQIREKLGVDVAITTDHGMATACGVYSTPQAVIIDAGRRLNYRGNYNKTRYCTHPETEYVRIALDSLLAKKYRPAFDQFALKAYGCQISLCKSN